MNKEQFEAIIPFIVEDLIKTIVKTDNVTPEEAISMLYTSSIYEQLEDEETKIWCYSTPMLYSLLKQEITTGKITFPDV